MRANFQLRLALDEFHQWSESVRIFPIESFYGLVPFGKHPSLVINELCSNEQFNLLQWKDSPQLVSAFSCFHFFQCFTSSNSLISGILKLWRSLWWSLMNNVEHGPISTATCTQVTCDRFQRSSSVFRLIGSFNESVVRLLRISQLDNRIWWSDWETSRKRVSFLYLWAGRFKEGRNEILPKSFWLFLPTLFDSHSIVANPFNHFPFVEALLIRLIV